MRSSFGRGRVIQQKKIKKLVYRFLIQKVKIWKSDRAVIGKLIKIQSKG